MKGELSKVQRRLKCAVTNVDHEIQRLESALCEGSANSARPAYKARKPNIDLHFEIKPPRLGRDPGLIITPEEARKRERLLVELRRLMKEIGSHQTTLRKMQDLEAKIRRDIGRLEGLLSQFSRDMARSAAAPETLERLRSDRTATKRALKEKAESLSLAVAAVREQERRIRELRKEIAEKGEELRFLLQARKRPERGRRRRGRGAARALALLGSGRLRF